MKSGFTITILALFCSALMNSCNKNDPSPVPAITSFSPSSGAIASSVTLTGANFSPTAANNEVKFNGVKAVVTASTSNSITATVPVNAKSGVITVTVGGQSGISTNSFTVNPLIGTWKFVGAAATQCTNSVDEGISTCSLNCPTLTFTSGTIAHNSSGGTFNFTYTLSGTTLSISSSSGDFSTDFVLSGSQLTLVYPPNECSLTEMYVKM